MDSVNCVWQAGAILGEGPFWDKAEQVVYWVDIKDPCVHRYDPSTKDKKTWGMDEPIGWMMRRRNQKDFIAGFKSGIAFVELDSGKRERILDLEPDLPNNRYNDAKCDRQGRLWAGTMDDLESNRTGCLYRIDRDLTWTKCDSGYVVTNGPTFSPDEKTLYHTDSVERKIYAFDLDQDGCLNNKRLFVQFGKDDGYPDGMTTDELGYIWVAHFGGWRLTRFAPDGKVDRLLELPVSNVTSCVFGGPQHDTLYITSAAVGLDQDQKAKQPLAGGFFEANVGVKGLLNQPFHG